MHNGVLSALCRKADSRCVARYSRGRDQRPAPVRQLEGFVFSELLKLQSWAEESVSLFHYRDKDQFEVDFVLENAAGQIVGIEVKAAASITRSDFRGLDRLAKAAGGSFIQGIVLYDGEQPLCFADNLRALPFAEAVPAAGTRAAVALTPLLQPPRATPWAPASAGRQRKSVTPYLIRGPVSGYFLPLIDTSDARSYFSCFFPTL
jgi:hypothetical protein